jgi:plastocyanin
MKPIVILIIVVVVVVVLWAVFAMRHTTTPAPVGTGSSTTSYTGPSVPPPAGTSTPAAAVPPPATATGGTALQPSKQTITIAAMTYSPASITVARGSAITWVNNDTVTHTVTADAGAFSSGNLAPGQKFTETFVAKGTFTYHCKLHPNMHGVVIVQ